MSITLTSPAGTVVTLTTDNGGALDDVFNGTLWDDAANPLGTVPYTANNGVATDQTYVNNTTATPLVPEEALAAFIGEDPTGTWTLTIRDDTSGQGGNLATWSLAVTTLPLAPAQGSASFSNSSAVTIADNAVTTSTISVSGATTFLCDVDVTTNITHAQSDDLDITVTSPAGTVVTLTTDNGGANDNVFNGTVWNDEANPSGSLPYTNNNGVATDHLYTDLTLASPLVPEEAMGAFIDEDPNGTWTLTISDDAATNTGTLSGWSLAFTTCPTQQADLSITKTDGVTTATAGGTTTYTIVVSNAGPATATGATVADTFPVACSSVSTTSSAVGGATGNTAGPFTGNISETLTLPAGGSVTYTAECTLAVDATGTLENTATVTAPGTVSDPTPGNNSATDSDTITPAADLAITKTDGVTTAAAGGTTTYTIVVSNVGPATATGATVADTFPAACASVSTTSSAAGGATGNTAGPFTGNISETLTLPAGSSVTYTSVCTLSGSASGTLDNTATVTAPGTVSDPTPGNNSATDSDSIGSCLSLVTLTPLNQVVPSGAGAQSVTVSAPTGCAWTAVSNSPWLGITAGSSGSGSGTVDYSVAVNPGPNPRRGTLTIAGKTFIVSQMTPVPAPCVITVTPTSATFGSGASMGNLLTVGASTGTCAWRAQSHVPWITITSSTTGSGPGNVVYSVGANPSPGTPRAGRITVNGKRVTITQN